MPKEIPMFVSVFLIAYAAFLSADLLAGRERLKSASAALLPAAAAVFAYALRGSVFCSLAVLLSAASEFFGMLSLSKRNLCVSAVAVLLSVSFCLTVQILLSLLNLTAIGSVIAAVVCLLFPLVPFLFKLSIFPSDYILTAEQKKTVFSRQFFFFPGPVLLIAWQVLLLSPAAEITVPFAIFTVLMQITVLLLLGQQVKSFHERIENLIDKQYQADLLSFMQVIRSQRHDFNFHMQTIYGMIESGQFRECRDYVASMMSTVQSTNDVLPLFHPATSALLNTFREMALQKGLKTEIEIHDNLRYIASSVYETNTILGNLLQNAIDELELHPENESKVIHLLILKRGRYNLIKVSNQCHLLPEEMSRIFVPGFTTKTSHEGLGLANALRIAEKYGGTVYPEFEGSTVHFIAKLPMQ